ncbi:MAG: hypothetical protein A2725_02250 [Candidatus Magasanikbacteria bacterium RIFCSPHIGHO2_01_FULL_33_34]|uniref:Glycosyltransferase RgtA/B/C/D-like domain-containing protein n=1 Tax=Candidatus Magasanikbacteria bacterium RIFCSPHIGHO2_01_FULL_33_34 TaxID=1798671 RepID=A0A1F6LKC6_9BACT|nr:MAG: hypothetical protein A2725_02250 [Candidatus Magasanikbacteria bacterium RIFCSPHIGHO2_01_FULL_33_34]OGH65655.1 MAG: hypothetical protein A3B83_02150 [Candidatus Magasanikbacteria bacterium RIFCSPHIGHO2_02_FULL_33_17]OGH75864.1 MAG: hypothetical protein A3A89_03045 [Candidatus Magasanikbacteria bacterium RIFCSPLOWO2_01_FULL_33_34]
MAYIKKFIYNWYPLFLILIPALFFRIHLLINRGTFWFDELFSIHFSTIPSWSDTIKYWILETNPPLYTFFLRFYLRLIDNSNEILVRLPSLFFSIASIILLYIFAQKIFSKRTAIISSILLSISGLNLLISTETRIYSLLTLLTILSFIFFYKLIISKEKENFNKNYLWIIYLLTNLLLLYAHLTSVVIVLIQLFVLHISRPQKETFKKWYGGHILISSIFLIWFIPSFYSKFNSQISSAWYFSADGNLFDLILKPLINSIEGGFIGTLFYILIILSVYLLILMIKNNSNTKEKNILIMVSLWAFLPPIFSSLLHVYILKYITISYPAIFLIFAYIADKHIKSSKLLFLLSFVIIMISLPRTIEVGFNPIFSWDSTIDYIEENENENTFTLIPFTEALPLNYYYRGPRPIEPIYLNDDNLSFEERLVRFNWNTMNTNKEEIREWLIDKIEKNNAKTIFFIQPSTGYEIVHETFLDMNWTLKNIHKQKGLSLNQLFEFEAPEFVECK